MSDTSQGPGWWLASDGKWYPPEAAAAAAAPAVTPPPAPTSSAARGCIVAAAIAFAALGVIVVVGIVVAGFFANRVADKVIGETKPCPFLTDDDASAAFGKGTTARKLSGISNVLVVIDARVMPNDPSCALVRDESSSSGGIGRIARYEGGDAPSRYGEERTKAKGISEDRGNGVTVTTDEYFNKDVDGVGDEAFCTTSSGVGAGMLARDGDTLVYVSVVSDVDAPPGLDLDDPDHPKLGTDDLHCEIAGLIARAVLRAS
jgi:hypothetical protein